MLIRNANVLLPSGVFQKTDLRFSDRIEALGCFADGDGTDAEGLFLLPGLIDVHTHGIGGGDFSDGCADAMDGMARRYAAHGVTAFLATTMTLPEDALCAAAAAIAAFRPQTDMAVCAGIHLEGPFLSRDKKGAQCAAYLEKPDLQAFLRIQRAAQGRVCCMTVAPELEGALPLIREVSKQCAVSIGHTAASYGQAAEAFHAGATQLTHLYNAMNGLHHRAPGPIAAGADAGVWAELICDGRHVHPAAVRAAFALFPDRILLISDSLSCTGLCDGEYESGGQAVTLKDGLCTLRGTDTIAGSAITLHDALRNAVRFGIPLEKAAAAATHHPAAAMGLGSERGLIRSGLCADLLLLDANLDIRAVYLAGKRL